MQKTKTASFIAFDEAFLELIGTEAKLQTIQSFEGEDANHVHEAPVYLSQTGELVFADTSVIGWLWALDVETHEVRSNLFPCHWHPPRSLPLITIADSKDQNQSYTSQCERCNPLRFPAILDHQWLPNTSSLELFFAHQARSDFCNRRDNHLLHGSEQLPTRPSKFAKRPNLHISRQHPLHRSSIRLGSILARSRTARITDSDLLLPHGIQEVARAEQQ